MITLGSLFDGVGGWQLAAVRNGVKPIWSSEIEKFPIEVTKYHFPNTKQLGDVNKIDGTKIDVPTIVCAGSPCQGLSVAGLRKGLEDERSGLFSESIRIIRQLKSRGQGFRFFVWENVPGAYSSNDGNDFRAVIESLAEADIPMPPGGRWAEAGVVQCPKCEIAWRTLDAQYWLPQRRKRIFLVCDFGSGKRCAAKVLFVSKSSQGDTQQKCQARERIASTSERSIRNASEIEEYGKTAIVKIRSGKDDGTAGKGALIGVEQSFALGCGNDQTLFQSQGTDSFISKTVNDGLKKDDNKESLFEGQIYGCIKSADSKEEVLKSKDGIITYDIKKTVNVRKHEVSVEDLKKLLKDSLSKSGLSKKDIAERLDVPQTQADHYFRQDSYFAVPDANVWMQLKELLGITTDEFDEQIMEFEEKECNFDSKNRIYDVDGVSPTLTSVDTDKTILQPIEERTLYDITHNSEAYQNKGISPTLTSRMGTGGNQVPILMENIPSEAVGVDAYNGAITGDVACTLTTGKDAGHSGPMVMERNNDTIFAIEGNGSRESHRGVGYSDSGKMYTLNTAEKHAVAYTVGHDLRSARFTPNVTDPLTSTDYKDPTTVAYCVGDGAENLCYQEKVGALCAEDGPKGVSQQYVEQDKLIVNVKQHYVVRRLIPLECERLMGLPDGWTDIPHKSCCDSARYRAIGNGMAQPIADWIVQRIVEEVGEEYEQTESE